MAGLDFCMSQPVQRPPTGLLASLWAFPGGFVRSPDQAKTDLRNRLKEDLGVIVKVGKHLASVDHAYTHFHLTLHAYVCTMFGSALHPPDGRAWQWLRPETFGSLPFSKVDRMIARIVLPSITL
jgi:A/G-specific adenine glycosylase